MSVLPLFRLAERVEPGQTTPVMVFPIGTWHTRKYGDLEFTPGIADKVIANFAAGALEQTKPFVDSGGHDEQSAATGWVQNVYRAPYRDPVSGAEGEAVWADVEWNDVGAALINERKFRYISPVLAKHIITSSGEEVEPVLRSLSPTNVPVLRAMPGLLDAPDWRAAVGGTVAASEDAIAPVELVLAEVETIDSHTSAGTDAGTGDGAAPGSTPAPRGKEAGTPSAAQKHGPTQEANKKETEHMFDELVKALALAEGVNEDTVLAEVTRLIERSGELETQLSEATERITGLEGEKEALEQTLADERKLAQDDERDRIIAALIEGGHIAPAEQDDLVALADSNFELFKKHTETRKAHRVIDLKDRGVHQGEDEPKRFADPSGEVTRRAKELQAKESGLEFMDAVRRVLNSDDDLSRQYGSLVGSGYDD